MTIIETAAELRQNRLDYLDRCWQSGYRAFEVGHPKTRCPFAKGSEVYKAWQQGWRKAKYEYEEAPVDE